MKNRFALLFAVLALFSCLVSCNPEPRFYNVTFDPNGAEGDVPDSAMVNAGGYFIVPSQGKLSMEGYVFDGWNTQANGEGVSYVENKFVEGVYADIELYAQWKGLHTIKLDANNDDGTSQITTNVVDGEAYVVPDCDFLPLEGKVFLEWNTAKDGNGTKYVEKTEIASVGEDVVLYEIWIDDPLKYENNGTFGAWVVKGFKAGAFAENVRIQAFLHDGKPVKAVEAKAFDSKNIVSVTIAEGVSSIGMEAFLRCEKLKGITIPSTLTNIGEGSFNWCISLETFKVDEGNTVYYSEGNCLIERKTKILVFGCKSSRIPSDVVNIGQRAFSGLYTDFSEIVIPDGVESIGSNAFGDCYNLLQIEISASVTSIGDRILNACVSLKFINYGGTEEQWNALLKGKTLLQKVVPVDDPEIRFNCTIQAN